MKQPAPSRFLHKKIGAAVDAYLFQTASQNTCLHYVETVAANDQRGVIFQIWSACLRGWDEINVTIGYTALQCMLRTEASRTVAAKSIREPRTVATQVARAVPFAIVRNAAL